MSKAWWYEYSPLWAQSCPPGGKIPLTWVEIPCRKGLWQDFNLGHVYAAKCSSTHSCPTWYWAPPAVPSELSTSARMGGYRLGRARCCKGYSHHQTLLCAQDGQRCTLWYLEGTLWELQPSKYSVGLQRPFSLVHAHGSFSVLCPLAKIKLTHPLLASVFSDSSQATCTFLGNR